MMNNDELRKAVQGCNWSTNNMSVFKELLSIKKRKHSSSCECVKCEMHCNLCTHVVSTTHPQRWIERGKHAAGDVSGIKEWFFLHPRTSVALYYIFTAFFYCPTDQYFFVHTMWGVVAIIGKVHSFCARREKCINVQTRQGEKPFHQERERKCSLSSICHLFPSICINLLPSQGCLAIKHTMLLLVNSCDPPTGNCFKKSQSQTKTSVKFKVQ